MSEEVIINFYRRKILDPNFSLEQADKQVYHNLAEDYRRLTSERFQFGISLDNICATVFKTDHEVIIGDFISMDGTSSTGNRVYFRCTDGWYEKNLSDFH